MTPRAHPWQHDPVATGRDEHGIGMLDDITCMRFLAAERVGRLGLSIGSLPVILPVNYVLDDHTIVFRSDAGAKTTAAARGSVACLEIDGFDRLEHTGWSVLATGRLRLADAEHTDRLMHLPVVPWALPDADRVVELPIELLSGRSIRNV